MQVSLLVVVLLLGLVLGESPSKQWRRWMKKRWLCSCHGVFMRPKRLFDGFCWCCPGWTGSCCQHPLTSPCRRDADCVQGFECRRASHLPWGACLPLHPVSPQPLPWTCSRPETTRERLYESLEKNGLHVIDYSK